MKPLAISLALLAPLLIGAAASGVKDLAGDGDFDAAPRARSDNAPWLPQAWRQVRIEQRFSIRIAPGTAPLPRAQVEEWEEEERVERVEERKIGRCVGINAIAAVQPGDADELLLFLHDQRVIIARLGKRCNARAFYSGFYVMRNADGAICAGRDILQSRSGAECKVRQLDALVPMSYRRFP